MHHAPDHWPEEAGKLRAGIPVGLLVGMVSHSSTYPKSFSLQVLSAHGLETLLDRDRALLDSKVASLRSKSIDAPAVLRVLDFF